MRGRGCYERTPMRVRACAECGAHFFRASLVETCSACRKRASRASRLERDYDRDPLAADDPDAKLQFDQEWGDP